LNSIYCYTPDNNGIIDTCVRVCRCVSNIMHIQYTSCIITIYYGWIFVNNIIRNSICSSCCYVWKMYVLLFLNNAYYFIIYYIIIKVYRAPTICTMSEWTCFELIIFVSRNITRIRIRLKLLIRKKRKQSAKYE